MKQCSQQELRMQELVSYGIQQTAVCLFVFFPVTDGCFTDYNLCQIPVLNYHA